MTLTRTCIDYSGLAPEELARYAALCRKGDEDSLMRAQLIFPNAVADAAAIKSALGRIASRPDAKAAQARLAQVERELADVADQIARLQERQAALRVQRSDAANEAGDNGFTQQMALAMQNAVIRAAVGREIEQAVRG